MRDRHLGPHQQDVVFLGDVSLSFGLPKATLSELRPERHGYLVLSHSRLTAYTATIVSVLLKVALNSTWVAIESVVSEIHVFVSPQGDLDVTMFGPHEEHDKQCGRLKLQSL